MTISPRSRSRRPRSPKPTSPPRPRAQEGSPSSRTEPLKKQQQTQKSPPLGGLFCLGVRKRETRLAHRLPQGAAGFADLRRVAAYAELDMAAAAVLAHGGQAEYLHCGVARADRLHRR